MYLIQLQLQRNRLASLFKPFPFLIFKRKGWGGEREKKTPPKIEKSWIEKEKKEKKEK